MLTQEINKKINKHRLLGSCDTDDISNLIYKNCFFFTTGEYIFYRVELLMSGSKSNKD